MCVCLLVFGFPLNDLTRVKVWGEGWLETRSALQQGPERSRQRLARPPSPLSFSAACFVSLKELLSFCVASPFLTGKLRLVKGT